MKTALFDIRLNYIK